MTSNRPGAHDLSAGEWLQTTRQSIKSRMDSPFMVGEVADAEIALAAQVLLAFVLGKTRAWVLAHPEAVLEKNVQSQLDDYIQRLCAGTPLPYLTGHQEFFGLDFEVNPDVLIPRPETELLVERALCWIQKYPNTCHAADVGTGSGCIAIALASHASGLACLAVDKSWRALQVARRNALRHKTADQISFVNGDLLSACSGPLDLVCANLPYIPHETLKTLPVAVHEPALALDGGEDGLSLVRSLVCSAKRWLAPGGMVLLEMQPDQGEKITQIAKSHLPDARVDILADLAGLPRVVEIIST